jgi:hypothetical protein
MRSGITRGAVRFRDAAGRVATLAERVTGTTGGAGGGGDASRVLSVCLGKDAGCSRGNNSRMHTTAQLPIAATPENHPRCVLNILFDSNRASSNMAHLAFAYVA